MTPTDEEIGKWVAWLKIYQNNEPSFMKSSDILKIADMLMALKENRDALKTRAEVVEVELELALQRMSDMESSGDDISHENESESSARDGWEQVERVEELEARIRVMEHDHGIDLSLATSRAEAAEERIAVLEHSLTIADRRVQQLLEAKP